MSERCKICCMEFCEMDSCKEEIERRKKTFGMKEEILEIKNILKDIYGLLDLSLKRGWR